MKRRQHPEFWSRRRLAAPEMAPEGASEHIRSRDREGWEALWNGAIDVDADEQWAVFLAGDATNKHEVSWLLS